MEFSVSEVIYICSHSLHRNLAWDQGGLGHKTVKSTAPKVLKHECPNNHKPFVGLILFIIIGGACQFIAID